MNCLVCFNDNNNRAPHCENIYEKIKLFRFYLLKTLNVSVSRDVVDTPPILYFAQQFRVIVSHLHLHLLSLYFHLKKKQAAKTTVRNFYIKIVELKVISVSCQVLVHGN